jgi:hypothetical protein
METCFTLHDYLEHEGPLGSLSTKGGHSSMVEDTPTAFEHAVEDVSWELFEEWFQERTRASGLVGPTTIEELGKAHWIHAVVNNCQTENQLTVLKRLGTVSDQTLGIWIDHVATESFIFGVAPKIIKVREVEQDEFIFVEMALGSKKKVGGKVTGCSLYLGEFVTSTNLYVTILGSSDVMNDIDWLESHEAILNSKKK